MNGSHYWQYLEITCLLLFIVHLWVSLVVALRIS